MTNKNKKETGIKAQKIFLNSLNNYILNPLDRDSKYNLFFIFIISEQYINNSFLSIYSVIEDNNYFRLFGSNNSYYNYSFKIINEERIYNYYRLLMIQVPIEKKTDTIFITYTYPYYEFGYYSSNKYNHDSTQIEIKGIQNFFYINNLSYKYNITLDNNQIFAYFLNSFFDKEKNKDESLQNSLMNSLKNKLSQNSQIVLSPEIIFKFLKYCLKFNLKLNKINSIIIERNNNNKISEEYYISNEDINKLLIDQYEKPILIKKIIDIYFLIGDIDKLIKSKKSKELGSALLEKLNEKNFNCSRLFNNEESIINFQNELLSFCTKKEELNYILNLSKGLIKYLKYISENYEKIYSIMKNNTSSSYYKYNYLLNLPSVGEEDTLEKIKEILIRILDKKNKSDYNIINYDRILEDFMTIYNKKKKSINEFCKLKDIIDICSKKGIELYNSKNLYLNIHKIGVNLINHNQMTIEEIIKFLYSQDIYYYDDNYKDLRETVIFKNISITDPNKNNLKNIEELKKKKVWELYKKSKPTLKEEFYKSLLGQIKYIKDFQYIFELFSIENIEKDFNQMIIDKLEPMKIKDLDRENCDVIFEIYSKLLICNDKNKLNLKLYIIPDYDFSSKYLFYLLKNNELKSIINKLKDKIINYFLEQHKKGYANDESLIDLLLFSPNNEFCLYLLNEMKNKILTEEEFYKEEEAKTKNFNLFKLFFEKCTNLIKKEEIKEGKYLFESVKIKNKIENDLSNSRVEYGLMSDLINEDSPFYNKILVICDKNEEKAKKIYDKIKNDLKKCNDLFSKIEKIKDFYSFFFKSSKKAIIDSIEKELEDLKKKNLNVALTLDEKINIENNEFNFENAVKESENLKYKDSFIFMAIFREKNQKGGTEQEIFDSSKKEFINSMTKIIKQKETKDPFFKINNVILIMNAINDKDEDDLKTEIDFISKDFKSLNKESYIKNNLLDDLVNFSKKDKVEKLLQGLIYFVESLKQLFQFQETEFINKLNEKYKLISSEGVSGEEIKESITLLSGFDYDVNIEDSLIKFYEIFYGKAESIEFIKKIKDSNLEIRNLNEFIDENENSQLQTTDIDNLLDIYTFFKSLIDNTDIKTDKSFHDNFRTKYKSEKDIIIKLQGYLSSYSEIIQLFNLYNENPEMTTQKINKILRSSDLEIYKDEKRDSFIFKIKYSNQKKMNQIKHKKKLNLLKLISIK